MPRRRELRFPAAHTREGAFSASHERCNENVSRSYLHTNYSSSLKNMKSERQMKSSLTLFMFDAMTPTQKKWEKFFLWLTLLGAQIWIFSKAFPSSYSNSYRLPSAQQTENLNKCACELDITFHFLNPLLSQSNLICFRDAMKAREGWKLKGFSLTLHG